MDELIYKNRERYKDPTAKKALRNILAQEEAERLEAIAKLAPALREQAQSAGFEIIGRIPFRHIKTGKEYK